MYLHLLQSVSQHKRNAVWKSHWHWDTENFPHYLLMKEKNLKKVLLKANWRSFIYNRKLKKNPWYLVGAPLGNTQDSFQEMILANELEVACVVLVVLSAFKKSNTIKTEWVIGDFSSYNQSYLPKSTLCQIACPTELAVSAKWELSSNNQSRLPATLS